MVRTVRYTMQTTGQGDVRDLTTAVTRLLDRLAPERDPRERSTRIMSGGVMTTGPAMCGWGRRSASPSAARRSRSGPGRVVLMECDTRARHRDVVVQLIGE